MVSNNGGLLDASVPGDVQVQTFTGSTLIETFSGVSLLSTGILSSASTLTQIGGKASQLIDSVVAVCSNYYRPYGRRHTQFYAESGWRKRYNVYG